MNSLKKTHYELFGLPEGFVVDAAALDEAYRRVQRAVHPDRFSAASDTDRRIAMQLATHANEAYRALRDPVARATYLCALHGVDPQVHSNTSMPAEFLGQQMEWRERLDEVRESHSEADLAVLREELADTRRTLLEGIEGAIDARADYASAAELVRQLMFVERFESDVDTLEERLAEH
jgi:molecular chaperone HscB